MAATVDFETLDPIIDRIVEHADDLAYLTLMDRTSRKRERRVGRLDLTPEELAPWLAGDTDPLRFDFTSPGELETDLLEGALRAWVLEQAEEHIADRDVARFRLRAYAVKGHRALASGMVVALDQTSQAAALALVEPAAGTALGTPDPRVAFRSLEVEASSEGMRALGTFYAQWGELMLGSMRQVQGVNHGMIDQLNSQVKEARGQVDELLGALLEHRWVRRAAAKTPPEHDAAPLRLDGPSSTRAHWRWRDQAHALAWVRSAAWLSTGTAADAIPPSERQPAEELPKPHSSRRRKTGSTAPDLVGLIRQAA